MIRPFLIIPSLIVQPTWGGFYIAQLKKIHNRPEFSSLKIGQSFELSGKSLLSLECEDSSSAGFDPILADTAGEIQSTPRSRYIRLNDIVGEDPDGILGPMVAAKYRNTMPLLIKLNQAAGNSFQLHIKPGQKDPHWIAKPESWYFFESGTITCGLAPETNLEKYKQCCLEIERFMKTISQKVMSGQKDIITARKEINTYIQDNNPHQFVKTHHIKKNSTIDLSSGAITHSWEENPQNPLGNIIYEVQLDVADDRCTIRSFDQGKIKDDGSIRNIHINDYFRYIETDPNRNNLNNLLKENANGVGAIKSPYYQMDVVNYTTLTIEELRDSYQHLFVRNGMVRISTEKTELTIPAGHSCFIPFNTKKYRVEPMTEHVVILRTHQPL